MNLTVVNKLKMKVKFTKFFREEQIFKINQFYRTFFVFFLSKPYQ